MKVLIISSVHKCNDIRVFQKQALSLAKEHEVHLAAIEIKGNFDPKNVKVYPLQKRRRSRRFLIWRELLRLFYQIKPDLVHFHDPELIFLGLYLKIFTRTKVIYDVHEDVPEAILSKYWIKKTIRGLVSKLFNIFEKTSSYFFDGIITVTPQIAKKFSNKNTIVVHNYSNLAPWHDFSLDKKENAAVFLGGITRLRGIDQIISATELVKKELPDFKLYIIGPITQKSYQQEIKEKAANTPHMEYLGLLEHNKALPYLRKSKIGLLCYLPEPNHMVGIPNKIFEYMSQGLIVLASNFETYKEILISKTNCGEICNPLEPESIATGIIKILKNPDLIADKGKRAIDTVQKYYSWNYAAKTLLELYSRLEEEDNK